MGTLKLANRFVVLTTYLLSIAVIETQSAVRDLTPAATSDDSSRTTLYRKTRDDRYYLNRYGGSNQGAGSTGGGGGNQPDRPLSQQDHRRGNLKPEVSPEARETDSSATPLEKRCIRCTGYVDPYDYRDYDRDRYYDRYDDRRGGYEDRYDARGGYDRYDRYDPRYENRYDRTPYERDRWYERRPEYDRSSYDRYDSRSPGYGADRYDRYDSRGAAAGAGAYDYRGFGYDNRGYDNRGGAAGGVAGGGYDYRKAYDTRGYRPWDETTRGTSGWDSAGRGYYFATGRPEPTGGVGYDRGYASGYNYGGGGRGDSWRDPYASGRPRDPYDGYRGTSYLYERNPSQPNTTTRSPPPKDGNTDTVTDRPDSSKSTDNTSGSG